MTEQKMTPEETLVEAYHVIFDLKDETPPTGLENNQRRMDLYGALNSVENVLTRHLGVERPNRFDGDGRTVENGGLVAPYDRDAAWKAHEAEAYGIEEQS